MTTETKPDAITPETRAIADAFFAITKALKPLDLRQRRKVLECISILTATDIGLVKS